MRTSELIDKLAPALVKAQAEMGTADKNSINPHFKNKYADLQSIVDAVKPALVKHKIAVLQEASHALWGDSGALNVTTLLLHESGQWLEGYVFIPLAANSGPQQAGSGITYGKRYGLAALLGIVADEDDDGNAAQGTTQSQAGYTATVKPAATRTTAAPPAGGGDPNNPPCPKCGGKMWDNREKKTNPKAPDFRCRDKQTCDGVLWPGDNLTARSPQPRTEATKVAVQAAREVGFSEVPEGLGDDEDTSLPF